MSTIKGKSVFLVKFIAAVTSVSAALSQLMQSKERERTIPFCIWIRSDWTACGVNYKYRQVVF